MNKRVSIIIPVYQAEQTIRRCLNSIVAQSYRDIEVWIIIDGFADSSEIICRQFEKEYNFIHVEVKKNQGASSARNLGLKFASGDYVYFMDADDELVSDSILEMVNNILSYDLLVFDFKQEPEVKTLIKENQSYSSEAWSQAQTLNSFFNVNISNNKACYGYLWNKLFKLDVIKNNNIQFDQSLVMWEDMLFCCSYLVFTQKVKYLPHVLYKYHYSDSSVSYSLDSNGYYNWLSAGKKIGAIIKKNFPLFFAEYMGVYANIVMEYILFCKKNHYKFNSDLLMIVKKHRKKLRKKYQILLLMVQFETLLHKN